MKKIVIIPARGGSQRILRKNIKNFVGKPLITYSIEAALQSELFSTIFVSTDDEEIAEISRQAGADVPFLRSPQNSDEHIGIIHVILEVLEKLKERKIEFDYYCCLFPTAPFITPQKLQKSFQIMSEEKADMVMSVCKYSPPVQRALKLEGRALTIVDQKSFSMRTQDLEDFYFDAGQFYWGNTKDTLSIRKLGYGKIIPYFLTPLEVQDIDNHEDWIIAELKYKALVKE